MQESDVGVTQSTVDVRKLFEAEDDIVSWGIPP